MIRKQSYGIGFSTHEVIKKCNTVARIDIGEKTSVQVRNDSVSGKAKFRNLSKKVLTKGNDNKEQNKREVPKIPDEKNLKPDLKTKGNIHRI